MRLDSNEQAHRKTKSFKRNQIVCFFRYAYLNLFLSLILVLRNWLNFIETILYFDFIFIIIAFVYECCYLAFYFCLKIISESKTHSTKKKHFKMYHVTQFEQIHTQTPFNAGDNKQFFFFFRSKLFHSYKTVVFCRSHSIYSAYPILKNCLA